MFLWMAWSMWMSLYSLRVMAKNFCFSVVWCLYIWTISWVYIFRDVGSRVGMLMGLEDHAYSPIQCGMRAILQYACPFDLLWKIVSNLLESAS